MPNVSNKIKSLLVDEKDYRNPQYIIKNINFKFLKENSVKIPDFNDFYNLITDKCLKLRGNNDKMKIKEHETVKVCLKLNNGIATEYLSSCIDYDRFFDSLNEIQVGEFRGYCASSLDDEDIFGGTGCIINADEIKSLINDLKEKKKIDLVLRPVHVDVGQETVFGIFLYNDKTVLVTYNWD